MNRSLALHKDETIPLAKPVRRSGSSSDSEDAKVQPIKVAPARPDMGFNNLVICVTVVFCMTVIYETTMVAGSVSVLAEHVSHLFDTWAAAGFPPLF